MLTLTETAVRKSRIHGTESPVPRRSRIRVVPADAVASRYSMRCREDAPPGVSLDSSGLRVSWILFSKQYLDGVQVDYVNSVMGSGFTLQSQRDRHCGCGVRSRCKRPGCCLLVR